MAALGVFCNISAWTPSGPGAEGFSFFIEYCSSCMVKRELYGSLLLEEKQFVLDSRVNLC